MTHRRLHAICVALGALLCLCTTVAAPAAAQEPEPLLGPVPAEIAAFSLGEREQNLATIAFGTLSLSNVHSPVTGVDSARATLLLLDGAGLRAVAEHLASGRASELAIPHLAQVIAECPLPQADLLLARAARSPRHALRLIAADGLGRGRTSYATALLGELVQDPVPGVRLAALRSLFAIESPAAAALRQDLAVDPIPALTAARLRWHRRVGEYPLPLLLTAAEIYRNEPRSELGAEAGAYLAHAGPRAPASALEEVLAGMLQLDAPGAPRARPTKSALLQRRNAVEAVLGLLEHPDVAPARRAILLEMAVEMVARPVPMDPMGRDAIPEHRLRQRLPDSGEALIAPVLSLLRAGAFADPRAGVLLLRELGPQLALPALRDLLASVMPGGACAQTPHAPWLRSAAVGVLRDLGRVEVESLARGLLEGDDGASLKIDLLLALEDDPSPWVVPMLREVLTHKDATLRSYALDVLERRPEAEARAAVVERLFARGELPHDRLATLVAPGDEAALALLARALGDERPLMREAALYQYQRHPTLQTPAARALLDEFARTARTPQEIQGVIYALLVLDPDAAVEYVKARWDTFPSESVRLTSLRQLQQARGPSGRAAIDFVLDRLAGETGARLDREASAVLGGRWGYRDEELAAFWRRMLKGENPHLRVTAVRAVRHPAAKDFTDLLIPLLFQAIKHAALGDDASGSDEVALAHDLVQTLARQEWAKVEPVLLQLVMTPELDINLRIAAAEETIGRLSEPARQELMHWMRYAPTAPKDTALSGAESDGALQTIVSAALGEGASADVATAMLDVLKREMRALLDEEWALQGEAGQASIARRKGPRVMALARGIAHARDPATILSLVEMLFDVRLGILARIAEMRGLAAAAQPTSDAAGRIAARLLVRAQLDERGNAQFFGVPIGVYEMFSPLRVLDDDVLATAFERALSSAEAEGRLGMFPDLYLMRLGLALHHEATGAMPKTAAVVGRFMARLSPIEGPHDYQKLRREVDLAALEGRFADAVAGQEALVRIVARQGADDSEPGTWVHERAALDAMRAARAAAHGDADQALAYLQQGLRRAASDSAVLNVVAWYAALGDVGLELAEDAARRAAHLETRLGEPPSRHVADTLAFILLKRGKPAEALAVLEPRLPDRAAALDGAGTLHWHMAQILLALGRKEDAASACADALTWDRALRPLMEVDPYLAALVGDTDLWKRVQHTARLARKHENLE